MSEVTFHSPSGDAVLRGAELHYARYLVYDIAVGLLGVDTHDMRQRLWILLGEDHHLQQMDRKPAFWGRAYETSFRVEWKGNLIVWRGQSIEPFDLALNTALLVGNEQVQFLARMAGQCEIHGYIEGKHRHWLADVIAGGLASGLYRSTLKGEDLGWGSVIELLHARDDEPVVMSYSVTDSFPNAYVAGWMQANGLPAKYTECTDEQQETWTELEDGWWGDLDEAERWRQALAGLRESNPELNLEISPWSPLCHFGPGLTVLDLAAPDYETRLDAALNTPATEDTDD